MTDTHEKPLRRGRIGQGSRLHHIEDGTQVDDNTPPQSCAKQRQAILGYLQQGRRLTTLYAREELGIMHPAVRVVELRKVGHAIVTHRHTDQDSTGTRHSVAEYVLMNG